MAGVISLTSSSPKSPCSPECGFNPATAIFPLTPNCFKAFVHLFIYSNTLSFVTASQAFLNDIWRVKKKTLILSTSNIVKGSLELDKSPNISVCPI